MLPEFPGPEVVRAEQAAVVEELRPTVGVAKELPVLGIDRMPEPCLGCRDLLFGGGEVRDGQLVNAAGVDLGEFLPEGAQRADVVGPGQSLLASHGAIVPFSGISEVCYSSYRKVVGF